MTALRPLGRRVAPALAAAAPRARFLRDRLRPGDGLGLELTTAVAVAGVGLYVFALYTVILSAGQATTPADRELLELADRLRAAGAVGVVKVVSDLGSPATLLALGFSVTILLAVRHRFAELGALLAGSLALFACLQLAKNGVDRPRPGSPLETASGSSFPSGHAAYSTLWIGIAVLLARVAPGFAKDAGLIAIALAIALAVGCSRVYLRTHYWSDVVGGWALGAAVLGTTAAATLAVVHIRHNGHERG